MATFVQTDPLDITNGARFETYVIEEPAKSGKIGVYGAAARLVTPGDLVIILAYCLATEDEARAITPRVVHVGAANTPRTDTSDRLST